MTDEEIQSQLNQISSDLIQVQSVSDLFKRLNISRTTKLSDDEKGQLKRSERKAYHESNKAC